MSWSGTSVLPPLTISGKKYPQSGVEIIPQATAVTESQSRSRQTFHKTDKDESSLRT